MCMSVCAHVCVVCVCVRVRACVMRVCVRVTPSSKGEMRKLCVCVCTRGQTEQDERFT